MRHYLGHRFQRIGFQRKGPSGGGVAAQEGTSGWTCWEGADASTDTPVATHTLHSPSLPPLYFLFCLCYSFRLLVLLDVSSPLSPFILNVHHLTFSPDIPQLPYLPIFLLYPLVSSASTDSHITPPEPSHLPFIFSSPLPISSHSPSLPLTPKLHTSHLSSPPPLEPQ